MCGPGPSRQDLQEGGLLQGCDVQLRPEGQPGDSQAEQVFQERRCVWRHEAGGVCVSEDLEDILLAGWC